jgi:ketosteroid isomerase-like protein
MYKIFISCAVGVFTMAPALASDKTDVMAVIQKWGSIDPSAIGSICADETTVIDTVPPYEWHGSGACSKWFSDYDAFTKQNGMTDGRALAGKARHIDITGDHAFVVVPLTYSYKQGGKDMHETATGTFTLRKSANGWRLTGAIYSPR